MNENQNDGLNYYPQDFQAKPEPTTPHNTAQNLFGQNEIVSMLLSGKFKNPFESNPLFNAIYSMQLFLLPRSKPFLQPHPSIFRLSF